MATCNVKGVAHSNKPTENYCPTLTAQSSLAFCTSLFWFYGPQLFNKKRSDKPTVSFSSTKEQTDKVKTVIQLIIFSGIGGDQTRAKNRLNIGYTFIRWPESDTKYKLFCVCQLCK